MTIHRSLSLVLVTVPFAATIFAIVHLWADPVSWKDLALLGSFYLASSLGITVGFHRMLCHNGFEANRLVKAVLLVFGIWSIQGAPLIWAATHLKHHVHSDKEEDPHSPGKSFVHAHLGWLFGTNRGEPATYAKAQMQDPLVIFIDRTAFGWALLGFLLPFLLGGWTGLLWAGFVRVFFVHHITWSVNSICHTFGSRPFRTGERSTNNWIVGLLAMGEGWHNNHHAFPRSAFHGLSWRQVDLSGYFISLLKALRLARNIYSVPKGVVLARLAAANPVRTFAMEG